ncbi:MAG: hypothetical protein JWQ27_2867 [Ferruginibacter sp.]|nr:hypothetical protein [Ferruginibacter sp.]
MKLSRKAIIILLISSICIFIHVYGLNDSNVEAGYSTHFYPAWARFLRTIFGRVPFSLGDILYAIAAILLLVAFFKVVRLLLRPGRRLYLRQKGSGLLYRLFLICASLYILFNLSWGINYDRKGIATQLGLDMKKYSVTELRDINCILVDKINLSKRFLIKSGSPYPDNSGLFERVKKSYDNIAGQYPYLSYQPPSLKSSLWSWVGNYTGFTGYYNPFTGEAQVNTSVPKFSQPFTACHEVGHQLGYAKEMEANFVGYLAASSGTDTLFHYSVYLDLFTYANRNLFYVDSAFARETRLALAPEVNADITEWIQFSNRHKNPVAPVVRWMYGKFLEGNRQPQGILSYDEVTAFIIAYYKKFGRI